MDEQLLSRQTESNSSLDLSVSEVLVHLAGLPPSPFVPYLTVALDWQPQGGDPGRGQVLEARPSERRNPQPDAGPSRRPSRDQAERAFSAILAELGPRGDALDSLKADIERISDYLDNELTPSAQGVFIVANSSLGVFEALALGLPLPTKVIVDPVPALLSLARLNDDYPTYAVILADQHDAQLSFISQATREHKLALRSTDYYRLTPKQGGWDQRRFDGRADERVNAFARVIADETQRALEDLGVDKLVVAGDEIITSALNDTFHPSVKERIVATIRLDQQATEQQIIEATFPLIEQAERDQESNAVKTLRDGFGAADRATAGLERTLTALVAGQVSTLIVNADLSVSGWADFSFKLFGIGELPTEHPAGGEITNIVPAQIEEELIRLALTTGSAVQIVNVASALRASDLVEIPVAGSGLPRSEPAMLLDEMGGAGALLRFN